MSAPDLDPGFDEDDRGGAPLTNRLIDQVMPEELDWVELVRAYPIPALAVAAAAGFYLGRVHGERLVDAAREITDRRLRETADRFTAAAEEALG